MISIKDLNDRVNLIITKQDLLSFAEVIIHSYSEQNQDVKYPERMTIPQVARYLNYSQAAIYKMVGNSSIPYHKLKAKGKILFKKTDVDSWLAEGRKSTVDEFCLQQDRRK